VSLPTHPSAPQCQCCHPMVISKQSKQQILGQLRAIVDGTRLRSIITHRSILFGHPNAARPTPTYIGPLISLACFDDSTRL
jgi:hypothetical protein